jgi:hypothetical protein
MFADEHDSGDFNDQRRDELDDVPTAELKALAWLRLRMQSEAGCEQKLLIEAEETRTGAEVGEEPPLIEKKKSPKQLAIFRSEKRNPFPSKPGEGLSLRSADDFDRAHHDELKSGSTSDLSHGVALGAAGRDIRAMQSISL